ncbi:hypothetical protein GCM10009745_63560 [Kribbella yunnanensis]|uniref:Uncharacterized protein n=1 Tax=Kribbella yunnanensis TaxID=190194 RepID=A0ABP4UNK1_9ACTN
MVRTVFIGAIPLGCLILFKRVGIEVHGALGDGLTILCIAWTALTYMSLLDPLFDNRLTAVREVLSTIRSLTDKK